MEHLMAAARFKCPAERESTRRDEFLILHLMANRKLLHLKHAHVLVLPQGVNPASTLSLSRGVP